MRGVLFTAIVAGLALGACHDEKKMWRERWKVGETVTLEGRALDEKVGAVLVNGDRSIYIDGLDRWPAGFYRGGSDGKRVRVTGQVIEKSDLPVFVASSTGGLQKAGIPVQSEEQVAAARLRWLLTGAKWEPLE